MTGPPKDASNERAPSNTPNTPEGWSKRPEHISRCQPLPRPSIDQYRAHEKAAGRSFLRCWSYSLLPLPLRTPPSSNKGRDIRTTCRCAHSRYRARIRGGGVSESAGRITPGPAVRPGFRFDVCPAIPQILIPDKSDLGLEDYTEGRDRQKPSELSGTHHLDRGSMRSGFELWDLAPEHIALTKGWLCTCLACVAAAENRARVSDTHLRRRCLGVEDVRRCRLLAVSVAREQVTPPPPPPPTRCARRPPAVQGALQRRVLAVVGNLAVVASGSNPEARIRTWDRWRAARAEARTRSRACARDRHFLSPPPGRRLP